jgi:hypothetical protein
MTNWTFTDTYLVGRKIVPFVTAPAEQNHSDRRRTGAWGDEHFPGGRPWRIPGRVNPLAEPARGWVRRHFSNRLVSGQRLRVISIWPEMSGSGLQTGMFIITRTKSSTPAVVRQSTHASLRTRRATIPGSPQSAFPAGSSKAVRTSALQITVCATVPLPASRRWSTPNEPPRLSLHHAGSRTCRRKSCRLPSLKLRSR